MLAKINFEGTADISMSKFLCVCAFCNNHDHENATIEFNFREQKILYLCGKCKKMNEICFSAKKTTPLPKISVGH